MINYTASQRRKLRDTPCARCGHAHAGWNRTEHYGWPGRCGEWLGWLDGVGISFGPCECPEWIQPELCVCGKPGERNSYLYGIKACSRPCAERLLRRSA